MRSLRPLLLLLLVGLAGCPGESPPPVVTNLGLSLSAFVGEDELWALLVLELTEGSDLNGDGDVDDVVLRVYDHGTGEVVDTGLALADGAGPVAGGELLAFGVSEEGQAGTDLNGDGDANDSVLHVYDRRTGVATNTGLATGLVAPVIGLDLVAWDVLEAAQGNTDLDGDGAVRGSVLHIYGAQTRLTTDVGREVTSPIQLHGHQFAFLTSELSSGDLNGDRDSLDEHVFAVLDALTVAVTTVPLSSLAEPLATPSGDWYLLVSEADQGLDLDGDGDQQDGVYHRVARNLQTIEPLELPSLDASSAVSNDRFTALRVMEVDGLDRNGDGDLSDSFVAILDSATRRTFEPALPIASSDRFVFLGQGRLAILVDEVGQGEDLNGDGDRLDRVAHLLDLVRETSTNLGFDGVRLDVVEREELVVTRAESDSANDWNGDGDSSDAVPFVWDLFTRALTNTRRAMDGRIFASTHSSFLLVVDEGLDGRDWNDDGDRDDRVFTAYDLGTRRTLGLGLAAASAGGGSTQAGAALFLVSEFGQGADLNGDGDLRDSILFERD